MSEFSRELIWLIFRPAGSSGMLSGLSDSRTKAKVRRGCSDKVILSGFGAIKFWFRRPKPFCFGVRPGADCKTARVVASNVESERKKGRVNLSC